MSIRTVGVFTCVLASSCSSIAWDPATPGRLEREPGWAVAPGVPLVRQKAREDCGVAALAMIFRRWKIAGDVDDLRQALVENSGDRDVPIAAGRIRDLARARGLDAFLIEGSTDDLGREIREGRPVMVGVVRGSGRTAYTHYQVVVGLNRSRSLLLTADPDHGWRQITLAAFVAEWQPAKRLSLVFAPRAI